MTNKIYRAPFSSGLRTSVMVVASCFAFSGVPFAAHAAGLGKVVVFSALGQPLRAEIEVSATRKELSDMKAQLASPDTFKEAGLDYATTLLGIRFSLDTRPDGQSVIKLSSDKPINDPFIDMLMELNWSAGRLVREYTFLLDPPEMLTRVTPPLSPVKAAPVTAPRTSALIDDAVRTRAVKTIQAQKTTPKEIEQPVLRPDTRTVKRGDTLRKIAVETKPDGVSLEQMLVGLMRANQDAFDGGNMNRLRAGKILSVPEKSAVESVSAVEARQIVVKQTSAWNAYRSRLASLAAQAPVNDEAAKQESSGKITAKIEEKNVPSNGAKDQLKVSSTVVSTTATVKSGIGSEEDLVAKEQALKEANQRLVALEKNVLELQKLVELKSQSLADLQKQATEKVVSADAKLPVVDQVKPLSQSPVPVATEVLPAKVEPVSVAAEPVVVPPVPPVVVAEKLPEPTVAPEPKPVEVPRKKPTAVVSPPPPAEPSFVEGLFDSPLALAGGAGILALLAGLFVSRRRRESKKEVPLDLSSTLTPQSSSLSANSVFRNTGGQSVDTSHTPVHTDFSQAGPGSIDTDEVDPVAEADVYMAYGRDAQAEEILLEAKQKDPKRLAIHLKLLEIYSNRADAGKFEALATDLYSETSGVGGDWEKAATMGRNLDPANPLFNVSEIASTEGFDPDATVVVSAESFKNTLTLPGELSQLAGEADIALAQSPKVEVEAAVEAPDLSSLDFDLGFGESDEQAKADVAEIEKGVLKRPDLDEEFNLPGTSEEANVLDFDLASTNDESSVLTGGQTEDTVVGFDFSGTENGEEIEFSASAGDANALDFELGTSGVGSDEETKVVSDEISEGASIEVQDGEVPDLDFDVATPPAEAEKLLVEALDRAKDDEGVEFDVNLTESTFLGRSVPETTSFDMASIDLDLAAPELVESPVASFEAEDVKADQDSEQDRELAATNVNPDFDAMQMETLIVPSPAAEGTLESSADQAETLVNPQFGSEQDLLPEFEISSNEEVTTKLDLAKAYEEMGDLEGARELLNEVLKEGDASHKEKAQAILARIGE